MAVPESQKTKELSDRVQRYQREFNRRLDRYEIRTLVKLLYVPSDEDINEVMAKFDANGDGTISFQEFTQALTSVDTVALDPSQLQQRPAQVALTPELLKGLRAEWDKLDKNNSGTLERKEARRLAQDRYLPPPELVDKLMSILDANGDNEVTFSEFAKIMEKYQGYLPEFLRDAKAEQKKESEAAAAAASATAAEEGKAAAGPLVGTVVGEPLADGSVHVLMPNGVTYVQPAGTQIQLWPGGEIMQITLAPEAASA